MDIPTFKGFLRNGKPTTADFARSLHSALTGVARYTVDGRDDELIAYRESMLLLAARIHEQSNAAEVESTVGEALEIFRNYNDHTLKYNHSHSAELKSVMRTMTETITYLSESRTRSVHQLQFVERELEQARKLTTSGCCVRVLSVVWTWSEKRLCGCKAKHRKDLSRSANRLARP